MSTPCETPGVAPQPTGVAAVVVRSVAEDLEAIFPPDRAAPASAKLHLRSRHRRRAGPAVRHGGYAGVVGALVAAALAGVSAGALAERDQAPEVQPAVGAALPTPGPLPSGPLHAPTPARVAAVEKPAPATPKPRVRKASTHHRTTHRRHDARTPSLMQADARLRDAYASARRAGVSSNVLTDYHDQWSSLRHRARREPRLVAARYDEMARELDAMAERHDRAAPVHHGAWYTLRTQIASLWR
jgi:hypothetical protein